jgi:hypothetical protein
MCYGSPGSAGIWLLEEDYPRKFSLILKGYMILFSLSMKTI